MQRSCLGATFAFLRAMARKITQEEEVIRREQPMNWPRAMLSGMVSAVMMMAFVDCFAMMGLIHFSFEHYLGSLIRATPYGVQNWTVGFLANLAMGGIFGWVYGYLFENSFRDSTARLGIKIGFFHAILAGILVFPFFNIMHAEVQSHAYPRFGFLGAAIGAATPLVIIVGHLLFGATMGTLYGPVRVNRMRLRIAEPGISNARTPAPGELERPEFEEAV